MKKPLQFFGQTACRPDLSRHTLFGNLLPRLSIVKGEVNIALERGNGPFLLPSRMLRDIRDGIALQWREGNRYALRRLPMQAAQRRLLSHAAPPEMLAIMGKKEAENTHAMRHPLKMVTRIL